MREGETIEIQIPTSAKKDKADRARKGSLFVRCGPSGAHDDKVHGARTNLFPVDCLEMCSTIAKTQRCFEASVIVKSLTCRCRHRCLVSRLSCLGRNCPV